jgi:rod shape-determining protein MreC
MRTSSTRPYLILLAALGLLMSLSIASSEKIRGSAIALIAPLWESVLDAKEIVKSPFYPSQDSDNELQLLRLENQLLRFEISNFRQSNEISKSRHIVIPSRVIFRSPSSWYSSLWINVGEADNGSEMKKIIAKNSPVMFGESLIGVIDYVGTHQSRVRLITDSGLSPSVRAVRGGSTYMAKGTLHGTSQPLWRNKNNLLKGFGFNYDFADDKGEARDLRTGKVLQDSSSKPVPLIKVGDLLMTTGMDGVFPEGLKVAEVTKIFPLREGDYYYDLEAKPTAGTLDDLSLVFVIPPLGYDPSDQPPLLGSM